MKKLVVSDILPPRLYEAVRDDMRRKVIEVKRHRRISVGDTVTLVFENRATMLFQVHEMVRAEHIEDRAKVEEELEVYNALLPSPGELSATLFVEVTDAERIKPVLHQMVGIDEHLTLHVGEHAVRAWFEPGRTETDRISSVQYIRFRLSEEARAALRAEGTKLALETDHPQYAHRIELGEETRRSLAADLE